jgi:hypothetical protein
MRYVRKEGCKIKICTVGETSRIARVHTIVLEPSNTWKIMVRYMNF